MIRVGLLGASGRMGQWVRKILEDEFRDRGTLVAQAGSSGPLEPLLAADVVIDFSSPHAIEALARAALAASGPLPAFVVGSTGFTPQARQVLEELARKTPVLMAANFSLGVQLLLQVLRQASPKLLALGYQPALVETHHQHKKDAPSGTALAIRDAVLPRAASPDTLPIQSIRAGEVIGDHEVTYYGPGDHLVFGHFAQDRSIFARGAVEVALWLGARPRKPDSGGQILGLDAFLQEKLPI